MKINAIVCEYNPLHNGHLYLLQKSKALCPDCFTVCIMSGNFVQRGEPAILDKWERTKWALKAGADIVIELPTFFALQTADKFALGAMKIATKIGSEGYVSFGSESDDIAMLKDIASTILPNNNQFKELLQTYLSEDLPFATARQKAILKCLDTKYNADVLAKTISSSNCILAIEYIKALLILESPLEPNAILRKESLYNDKSLSGEYSSATSIRESINKHEDFSHTVPSFVLDSLSQNILPNKDYFDNIILYKLRAMSKEQLEDIIDVNEGLENLIIKAANKYNTLEEVIAHATNKRYTSSRIRRICYSAMLDITKQKYLKYNDLNAPIYARVLGFKKEAQPLLKHIKYCAKIPLITSVKEGLEIEEIAPLLALDIMASDIYALSLPNAISSAKKDFTNKIIVI